MKVRINYRALCPYDTNAKGEDLYQWYTDEFEAEEIQMGSSGFLQIRIKGREWSCFEAEQINSLTVIA